MHYKSLTISRDIDSFVDAITINVNNPQSRYSSSISVGKRVNVYVQGVLIFRGLLEKKNTRLEGINNTMTLSGREDFVSLVEDDANPTL